MSDSAVEVQHVSFRYGERLALRDISFSVAPGVLFGLLGPNGGGKTTLFRILSTLLQPVEGSVRVLGHDAATQPDAVRKGIGMIFQQPALDEALTVYENLRCHGALYGLSGTALRQRIDRLLEDFGVADRRGERIKTLSGGLKRRVDLVRGLLHAPPLLLLDEPTTGLDPAARRTFWQMLARLRRQERTTMIVATHLMEEADECDAVGIIDRGRLAATGSPETLKQALGGETLWLDTRAPQALADRLQSHFGLAARLIDTRVQVSHPEAHALLPRLYEAFGDQIDSATVRKPTLEDVFMVHAGYRLDEPVVADGV